MATQSLSSKLIDKLITRSIAPTLRSAGFTRRARAFERRSHDVVHCIHFLAWKWNTPNLAQFTGNVIVVWPRWHEVWTGRPFKAAHTAAPIAEDRVGSLALGRDTWWEVTPHTDLRELGDEVARLVTRASDMFFDRYSSLKAILAFLESGGALPGIVPQPLIHATALAQSGDLSRARALLSRALEEKPDWHYARMVAQRLGLSPA